MRLALKFRLYWIWPIRKCLDVREKTVALSVWTSTGQRKGLILCSAFGQLGAGRLYFSSLQNDSPCTPPKHGEIEEYMIKWRSR